MLNSRPMHNDSTSEVTSQKEVEENEREGEEKEYEDVGEYTNFHVTSASGHFSSSSTSAHARKVL